MQEYHPVPPGEPPLPPTPHVDGVFHYLHDVLGSVIGLVDETGTLRERYTYDPYGRVFIEHWGADPETGGAWLDNATAPTYSGAPAGGVAYSRFCNPFMWTGHRYDAAVGLYATHYRAYSPTIGRWLQRDPIEYEGGSINLYEYVQSSPLYWIDPMGLSPADLRRRLKKLCATKICPDRSKRVKFGENGEACLFSDPEAYDQCVKNCESEADKIVDCIKSVISSANRGLGAICTNINAYSEYKACQLGLNYFRVEAFRPIRCRDEQPGRHVVTGIGSTGDNHYDVIVDALNWNVFWPPNLKLHILDPNDQGLLEDQLPSQDRERHRTDGPRRPPREPFPWETDKNIFPPK